jgi:hypothetical protein
LTATSSNLTIGGGAVQTVTVASDLVVNGTTTLQDATVLGRLTVGAIPDVEVAITTNAANIQAVDTRVTTEVNRLDGRINVNASNIAQNRQMIGENRSMIMENRASIARLDKKISDVESTANAGVAAAATLGSIVSPSEAGKTSVTSGIAFYEGEAAVGVNATHRFAVSETQDLYLNGGLSVTSDSSILGRVLLGAEF